jgi:uncharacterized membrane protein YqiK
MSGAAIGWIILGLIVLVVVVVLVFWLLSWLYRRSSEISFVRTGFGGQEVVINGGTGAADHPRVIQVNMNTLRLEVRRGRSRR